MFREKHNIIKKLVTYDILLDSWKDYCKKDEDRQPVKAAAIADQTICVGNTCLCCSVFDRVSLSCFKKLTQINSMFNFLRRRGRQQVLVCELRCNNKTFITNTNPYLLDSNYHHYSRSFDITHHQLLWLSKTTSRATQTRQSSNAPRAFSKSILKPTHCS